MAKDPAFDALMAKPWGHSVVITHVKGRLHVDGVDKHVNVVAGVDQSTWTWEDYRRWYVANRGRAGARMWCVAGHSYTVGLPTFEDLRDKVDLRWLIFRCPRADEKPHGRHGFSPRVVPDVTGITESAIALGGPDAGSEISHLITRRGDKRAGNAWRRAVLSVQKDLRAGRMVVE